MLESGVDLSNSYVVVKISHVSLTLKIEFTQRTASLTSEILSFLK